MASARSSSMHQDPVHDDAFNQIVEDVRSADVPWAYMLAETEPIPPSGPSLSCHRCTTTEDVNDVDDMNGDCLDTAATDNEYETPPCTPPDKLPRTGSAGYKDVPTAANESTPLTKKNDGRKNAIDSDKVRWLYIRQADDAAKHFLGPMPVKDFIDTFLPPALKDMPDPKGAFDSVVVDGKVERDIYGPLIQAIDEKGFCPTVAFLDTSSKSEESGVGQLKPDVCGFDKGDRPHIKRRPRLKAERYEANFGLMETFWEIKKQLCLDPFLDDHDHEADGSFLCWLHRAHDSTNEDEMTQTCGQVVSYAAECFSRQHRSFLFSALVIGSRARLFRWDHAGIIVTKSFDYRDQPELLCEFLWRFSYANPAERGFDPTVSVASADEQRLFERLITNEVAFQKKISLDETERLNTAVKRHYQRGKVTKVKVFDENGKYEECLVSVPFTSPEGTTGRASRTYWSVKPTGKDNGVMVFLKDYWRVDLGSMEDEGTVYKDLNENEVSNVPTVKFYGNVINEQPTVLPGHEHQSKASQDVQDPQASVGNLQVTLAQEFMYASWVCKCVKFNKYKGKDDLGSRVFKHTHYRVILGSVGQPLSEFAGSLELFTTVRDALSALISAYEKCNRLHRDISFGNIIIVRLRETGCYVGYLIDWEFSTKADREGKASDCYRSGTWAFMSAASLDKDRPGFRHSLVDDLESVFYVVVWACAQWVRHSFKWGLHEWMVKFFDEHSNDTGEPSGGTMKLLWIREGDRFSLKFKFDISHLNDFFRDMYRDLSTRIARDGTPVTWTAENVKKHFDTVCSALTKTPSAATDRCKSQIDYPPAQKKIPDEPKATHTPSRMSGVSDIHPNPEQRGSKQTLREEGDAIGGGNGKEPLDTEKEINKRKRLNSDLERPGEAEAPDRSTCESGPPTSNISESSRRDSRVLTDRSSASNQGPSTSRRTGRHPLRRVTRRKSRGSSSRSSKSGSQWSTKARSDILEEI